LPSHCAKSKSGGARIRGSIANGLRRRAAAPTLVVALVGGLLASTGTANTAAPAAAPQLAAAAAGTPVVAQDSFGRTVSGGWGSADLGGAYQLGPDATQFKVGSGAGAFPTIQPGKAATALLPSVSLLDSDVQSTFALPSVAGAGVYSTLMARTPPVSPGRAFTAR